MIRLTMLPARDGDCMLLEYGTEPSPRRILIDGGRSGTYQDILPMLNEQAKVGKELDLLVITHVDQDHVLGILSLFQDVARPIEFRDVWFNGYDQLVESEFETFGPRDGELLTTSLLEQRVPWNAAFGGRAVQVGRPFLWPNDGAQITLLSPDRDQLKALIPDWETECAKNGLIPGKNPDEPLPVGFEAFGRINIDNLARTIIDPDPSKTNRTSIAFLFEYEGVRLMFTGDASDERLVDSIRPLAVKAGGRLRLDAMKVAHHGSHRNISRELLDLIDCKRYLISSSGAHHRHPDPVAMARILKYGGERKEIVFNYGKRAELWDSNDWKRSYGFSVIKPDPDGFVTLDSW